MKINKANAIEELQRERAVIFYPIYRSPRDWVPPLSLPIIDKALAILEGKHPTKEPSLREVVSQLTALKRVRQKEYVRDIQAGKISPLLVKRRIASMELAIDLISGDQIDYFPKQLNLIS